MQFTNLPRNFNRRGWVIMGYWVIEIIVFVKIISMLCKLDVL